MVCSVSTTNSAENEEQGQKTYRSSERLRFDEKGQRLIALFAANWNAKETLNCVEWVSNRVQKTLCQQLVLRKMMYRLDFERWCTD